MGHYVLGITGASGIVLALHALKQITASGHKISIVMTRDATATASVELKRAPTPEKMVENLSPEAQKLCTIYRPNDFFSPIASGSHPIDGMIIIPCSMSTLAAVSMGLSDNLVRRAADVTLKEKKRLVIVPREAPFSEIHLENMLRLSRAGAVIVPPIPAWYTLPKNLEEAEQAMVSRALEVLGIEVNYSRWEGRNPISL